MTDTVVKLSDVPRDTTGKFVKGSPGRPFGAKGRKSREALERVKTFGPEALQKLYEAVNAGERWAVEFVLSKILPTSRTVEFEAATPEDLTEALRAGDITPVEAKDVATALAKLAEISELAELKAKLEELEQAIAEK